MKKISELGKKKLTEFIDDLINHVDKIWDYSGIPTDDADQVYSDCRDAVWNWVNDEGICSWSTEDSDSVSFITEEIERLAKIINNRYNL